MAEDRPQLQHELNYTGIVPDSHLASYVRLPPDSAVSIFARSVHDTKEITDLVDQEAPPTGDRQVTADVSAARDYQPPE